MLFFIKNDNQLRKRMTAGRTNSSLIDMTRSNQIPQLDAAGLRKFAITSAVIVIVLFALLIPWLFGFQFPRWPWILGGILATWGVIAPKTLKPLYNIWMRFGLIMNRITTPIILGIVFFLVITPIALVMRVFGRDELRLGLEEDSESYKIKSTNYSKNKMEHPY